MACGIMMRRPTLMTVCKPTICFDLFKKHVENAGMKNLIDVDAIRSIVDDELYEQWFFQDVCPWKREYYTVQDTEQQYLPVQDDGRRLERGNLTRSNGISPLVRAERNGWLRNCAKRELASRRAQLFSSHRYSAKSQTSISAWGVLDSAITLGTYEAMHYSDQGCLASQSWLLGREIGVSGRASASVDTLRRLLSDYTDPTDGSRIHNVTAPEFKSRHRALYYLRSNGRYEFAARQMMEALLRMAHSKLGHVLERLVWIWCVEYANSFDSFQRTVEVVNMTRENKLILNFDAGDVEGFGKGMKRESVVVRLNMQSAY